MVMTHALTKNQGQSQLVQKITNGRTDTTDFLTVPRQRGRLHSIDQNLTECSEYIRIRNNQKYVNSWTAAFQGCSGKF